MAVEIRITTPKQNKKKEWHFNVKYLISIWCVLQIRVSAVLSNAPYLLNVDCDHYINNSKALREAMCFMMDPISGKKICYVQFPQRFDGIDRHDRYSNRNVVFFDVSNLFSSEFSVITIGFVADQYSHFPFFVFFFNYRSTWKGWTAFKDQYM